MSESSFDAMLAALHADEEADLTGSGGGGGSGVSPAQEVAQYVLAARFRGRKAMLQAGPQLHAAP